MQAYLSIPTTFSYSKSTFIHAQSVMYLHTLHISFSRSHCPNTFPDQMCRSNYNLHQQNPPLLFNLEEDPGEVRNLDTQQQQYANVIKHIDQVRGGVDAWRQRAKGVCRVTQIKEEFESNMWWAPSQVNRGIDKSLLPCANQGCSSYPSCCHT